jgi:hypothetical protein
MYALLKAKEMSTQALASIVISAMTAGASSATISFDYDTNPIKRKNSPDFYGYIPVSGARTAIFGCMFMNGTLLLLVKCFGCALLLITNKSFFILYMTGNTGLYLLQKVARSDFPYWLPLEGKTDIAISIIARVMVKIIADFTGIAQFRASAELGGIYWSFNLFEGIVSAFLMTKISFDYTMVDGIAIGEETAWRIIGSLGSAWLLFFVLFLNLVDKKYLKTFVSRETGTQWGENFFLRRETDSGKCEVMLHNKKQWKAIEPDVKEWVMDGWENWEEEKPSWFSEAWKSRIPDDWLPPAELRRQKINGGGKRRRSSIGELIGSAQGKRGSATVFPVDGPAEEGVAR